MVFVEKTKVKALREAKNLLQSYGFNAFSFQHVADSVGIKKPGLYDHFASKELLGVALIEDYLAGFQNWTEIVEVFQPYDRLGAYFELLIKFLQDRRKLCPMPVLISDLHSLPESMQRSLRSLFQFQAGWIEHTIFEGQQKGVFRTNQSAVNLTPIVISMSIGGQMTARITNNALILRSIKEAALAFIAIK